MQGPQFINLMRKIRLTRAFPECWFSISLHRSENELRFLEIMIDHSKGVTADIIPKLSEIIEAPEPRLHLQEQMKTVARLRSSIKTSQINWIGVELSPDELTTLDRKGRKKLQRYEVLRESLIAAKAPSKFIETALFFSQDIMCGEMMHEFGKKAHS